MPRRTSTAEYIQVRMSREERLAIEQHGASTGKFASDVCRDLMLAGGLKALVKKAVRRRQKLQSGSKGV